MKQAGGRARRGAAVGSAAAPICSAASVGFCGSIAALASGRFEGTTKAAALRPDCIVGSPSLSSPSPAPRSRPER
eukprot:136694-Chlamydomonas_euryale.AAC.4